MPRLWHRWETAKLTRYRAYGLEIECERELPLRPGAAAGEADLRVVDIGRFPRSEEAGPDRRSLEAGAAGWTLRYDNRDGDWMAYDYRARDRRLSVSASLPWEISSEPLAGVVCGVLLGLEGRTLLHGACLKLGDSAVALLGASGHGKSTLAAALAREGAALLTEDLLVLARTPTGWAVEPGAPSLHLLEDSYAALGAPLAEAAPKLREGKFAIAMSAARSEPAPLAAIYILDPPAAEAPARIAALSGRHAVMRMLDHLYGAAWIRPRGEADLRFCAELVSAVPVHALSRPWRLDRVGETAALLRRHVSAAGL
jgi:hypothetical protein